MGGRHLAYIRASTGKQQLSPETQRRAITDYAATQKVTIDEWYVDPAESSTIPLAKRPAGKELLAELRSGDTVWFAKIDRPFRSLLDFMLTVDRWDKTGIRFKLCDLAAGFDFDTPHGRAFLRVFAVFAEFERELISQRTKEALAHRKQNGNANSKYAGYGFRWEKRWDAKLGRRVKYKVPDHDERHVMRHILAWRASGYDFEQIREHLNQQGLKTKEGRPWSLSRIRRAYIAELKLQQEEAGAGL